MSAATLGPAGSGAASHARPAARAAAFTGTWLLSRAILRRDRVRLLVWTLSVAAFTAYFSVALTTIFDPAALAARAEIMRTPSGIVMGGPGYGIDHYTPLVALANESTGWIVVALAIMCITHVVRHTRAEEESARSELLRASAVGRFAPALAAMLTLVLHLVIIAVLSAAGMLAGRGEATAANLVNALVLMAACCLSALVFGAVALVTSQLSEHSRTASGIALAVFGAAFAVRAAGDLIRFGGSPLSWASPIAWAQQTRAFVDLRSWPLLLSVAASAALLIVASAVSSRRDFGRGILADRSGSATAPRLLGGPVGLAWRQQRGALCWTALGLALLWFGTGTLMKTLDGMVADLVKSNRVLGAMFGTDPAQFANSFIGFILLMIGMCAAAYAIVATNQRLHAEESSGRVEAVLALPVGRGRWLTAQLLVASLGAVGVLATSVYALWGGAVLVGADGAGVGPYTQAFLAYVPAVLAFPALAAAAHGWAPRLTGVSWALLAYVFVATMFGAMFEFPAWLLGISPFHWVPDHLGGRIDTAGLFGLCVAMLVLFALGLAGFRRRDVVAGT